MRVALKVGTTVYPLAGESGVSERTHSSAGEFAISAEAEVELIRRVRAATVQAVDRGNLATTIQFSTTRQFSTPAEAFLYSLDHDDLPRAGTLIMESVAPGGAVTIRHLLDAVVMPPSRRVVGSTVLLDYTATGGAVIPFVPNTLTTAFAGANNDLVFTQVDYGTAPTIQFTMDNAGGNDVTVTSRAILIHLRQTFGAFYLPASDIKTLIEASSPAMALISVAHAPGSTGAGAVCDPVSTDISFGPTALST